MEAGIMDYIDYMYGDSICTRIMFRENGKLRVINYTDDIVLRAFGTIEHPTIRDFNDLLEQRCFPESRRDVRHILRTGNLPAYDRELIIRKTHGQMSDDLWWFRFSNEEGLTFSEVRKFIL